MTEEHKAAVDHDNATANALAQSKPDENLMFVGMLDRLMAVTGPLRVITLPGAVALIGFWTLVKFGAYMILALFPVLQQWWQHEERQTQTEEEAQKNAAQRSQETAEVLDAIHATDDKIDTLKQSQDAQAKRLQALSASQQQIQRQLREKP